MAAGAAAGAEVVGLAAEAAVEVNLENLHQALLGALLCMQAEAAEGLELVELVEPGGLEAEEGVQALVGRAVPLGRAAAAFRL
jgi:hypothetical protein